MPFHIVRAELAQMDVEAIVIPDGFLLLSSKPENDHARTNKNELSREKIPDRDHSSRTYVIHTTAAGPGFGTEQKTQFVESYCRSALAMATEHGCESVAFPLITAGTDEKSQAQAFRTSVRMISAYVLENELDVYLVIPTPPPPFWGEQLFRELAKHLRNAQKVRKSRQRTASSGSVPVEHMMRSGWWADEEPAGCDRTSILLPELDESFSEMLLRKIDEKGLTDAQCYKKANIDRKLFSKIRNDVHYSPSKPTAIAFAIALELSLGETEELLKKAGFALSHSNVFDLIIEYFIQKGNYNIFEINEALFAFDQHLLGA